MKILKKITSVFCAVALAGTMCITASAAELDGSANVAGYLFEMVEWQKKTTEPVVVDHYGTYTVSLSGISVPADMIGSFYLKDYDFETNSSFEDSNLPKDIIINTKSIKVNGNEYTPKEGYATTNESGKFEVTYVNFWGDSFLDLTSEGTITSFEITFEVAPANGSSYEETTTAGDVDATPSVDTSTDEKGNPATGVGDITMTIVLTGISVAAVAFTRKRK